MFKFEIYGKYQGCGTHVNGRFESWAEARSSVVALSTGDDALSNCYDFFIIDTVTKRRILIYVAFNYFRTSNNLSFYNARHP